MASNFAKQLPAASIFIIIANMTSMAYSMFRWICALRSCSAAYRFEMESLLLVKTARAAFEARQMMQCIIECQGCRIGNGNVQF